MNKNCRISLLICSDKGKVPDSIFCIDLVSMATLKFIICTYSEFFSLLLTLMNLLSFLALGMWPFK